MSDIPKSEFEIQKLLAEKKERLKELACINRTTEILKEGRSVEETLRQIVLILPRAWQYPEFTVARLKFAKLGYITPNFRETEWKQAQTFRTIDDRGGSIEIFYLKEFEEAFEGPFLKEERDLINNLAGMIANYLNTMEARRILRKSLELDQLRSEISEFHQVKEINSRKLLQTFLNNQNVNRDIYHDMMPFKVREVLLVATLYDAYTVEKEGRFSEHILGEHYQANLTSMPRVTGVSTYDEAMEQMSSRHFDLVIIMIGADKETPLSIARAIKDTFPYIKVNILLNNKQEVVSFKEKTADQGLYDKLFVWNGDSRIFFTMVKLLEDKVNVENDTEIGLVKAILLVEDSEIYYSRYLPLLYSSVFEQTRRIMLDQSTDELYKILRLRARPKVLLASNYEEAIEILEKYGDFLLCLITDVIFQREGKYDDKAGFRLVKYARDNFKTLPTIIQSSDMQNARMAFELKSVFINKNSETLLQDIKSFISHHLGFGNFEYRDPGGRKIAEAKSLKEFEKQIETIPIESLIYHGKRNHFSLWLMARGEIKIAKMIFPVKVTDFKTPQEFRDYLKYVINKYRNESNAGKIVNFEESALLDESNIVSLGTGALGGKGRGLAFINTLIYNLNFSERLSGINIRNPKTSIIGTDEFDFFIERNNLTEIIHGNYDYSEIREIFLRSELSFHVEKKLKTLLNVLKCPLAVRSSSLLEDSTNQAFSGVFETYLLPNNHPDIKIRYQQLADAVRLVYASIYSADSRAYFDLINYNIEDEKMAVIIQEVVGYEYDGYLYPHISGTAQSHNYYPVAHMKPEDGFALAALGLGHYVVNGERSYRFSPKYPDLEVSTPKTLIKESQLEFIALDLHKSEFNFKEGGADASLVRLKISEAEKHGTLNHLASVYDPENDRLQPGLSVNGPRIINFSNILKYNYIPLAKTLEFILDVGKEAMGSPIEIEYALTFSNDPEIPPSFYLLQIKPLVGSAEDFSFNLEEIDKQKILIFSEKSMGNGEIQDISDIIFVKRDVFDKTKTKNMVSEIDEMNRKISAEGRHYILIGPGRWGTRDQFIGIPVNWINISAAKVIIEISLADFPLDASLGSHFFHNVTSMNIGYFSIQHNSKNEFIDWNILEQQELVTEGKYFKHVRFSKPLNVIMEGKKQFSLVYSK